MLHNKPSISFGNQIRVIREKVGFTQEYLASELGVSQRAYSKLETGETQIKGEVLFQIARILNVDLMDLIPQEPSLTYYNYKTHNGHAIAHYVGDVEKIEELHKSIIASKNQEIESLKEMITILKKILEEK